MPTKFDTNPLDPDFPEKLREAETAALPKNDYSTAEFPPVSETEKQTQKFDSRPFNEYKAPSDSPYNNPYGNPYDGQNIPAGYRSPRFAEMNQSSKRKVSKIGLPENILTALPYLPFWGGLIAGIVILILVPRNESKVRFHAAQGLAAQIGILIIAAILKGISTIPGLGMASIGSMIFGIVTAVMLIVFAVKAFTGKPVHIEAVDGLTEWLDEKIEPRNKF